MTVRTNKFRSHMAAADVLRGDRMEMCFNAHVFAQGLTGVHIFAIPPRQWRPAQIHAGFFVHCMS